MSEPDADPSPSTPEEIFQAKKDANVIGEEWLKTLDLLPAIQDAFPPDAPPTSAVLTSRFSGPASNPNEGFFHSHRDPSANGNLRSDFLRLQTTWTRSSPQSRIWKATERFELLNRISHGGALMMIRLPTSTDSLSPPLLAVCGPIATSLRGSIFDTQDIFGDDNTQWPTLPTAPDTTAWDTYAAPAITFLSANSRDILQECSVPSLRQSHLINNSCTLFCPEARASLLACPFQSSQSSLIDSILQDDPLSVSKLWLPDIDTADPDESPTTTPDQANVSLWATGAEPPSTFASDPWDPSLADSQASAPAKPPNTLTPVSSESQTSSTTSPGGWFMLPQTMLLPVGHALPIGLLLDPSHLTSHEVLAVLAHYVGYESLEHLDWLNHPVFHAWYSAIQHNPATFAIPWHLYPPAKEEILAKTAQSSPFRMHLRHAEWAITHRCLTDFALATATKSLYPRLQAYFTHMWEDASALSPDNTEPILSPSQDFHCSTYAIRARPPATNTWLSKFRLDTFTAVPNDVYPPEVQQLHIIPIEVKAARDTRTPIPITITETLNTPTRRSHPDHSESPAAANPAVRSLFAAFNFCNNVLSPPKPCATTVNTLKRHAPSPAKSQLSPAKRQKLDLLDLPQEPPIFDPTADDDVAASPTHLPTWFTPAERPDCDLPSRRDAHPPSLTILLHYLSDTSEVDDGSSLRFHPAVFSKSSSPNIALIRRAAILGSFRLPHDTIMHQRQASALSFPPSCMNAPAWLGKQFVESLLSALGKAPTNPACQPFIKWCKEQCRQARRSASNGPACFLNASFFTSNIIAALQSLQFCSGFTIEERANLADGRITPYHFIPSIPAYAQQDYLHIPPNGLPASDVAIMIQNMIFLLHLPFRDHDYFKYLGQGHSPFSRFSPLAGHLLWLLDLFKSFTFQTRWDRLDSSQRFRRTEGVLNALNALFQIYDDWMQPSFQDSEFFMPATHAAHDNIILLRPSVLTRQCLLHDKLKDWRLAVTGSLGILSMDSIYKPHPLWKHATPSFLLAQKHDPRSLPRDPRTRQQPQLAPPPPPATLPPRNPNYMQKLPPRHPGISHPTTLPATTPTHTRPNPAAVTPSTPQVTPGENIAKVCLVARKPGTIFRPMYQIINTTPHPRPRTPRVNDVPPGQSDRPVRCCFAYVTEGGFGCSHRTCTYQHLDLADPRTQAIRREFFRDLIELLHHPVVQQHFEPTQALRTFCQTIGVNTVV